VKRLLLNCDQVFEVLTRGPFPSGAPEDEAVERHLRACHECRQLAEALRPAVALLHEAVSADEALDLPEYQGSLPWKRRKRRLSIERILEPLALDQNASPAAPGSKETRGEPRQPQTISAVRFIAASLLIAALGLLFGGTMLSPSARQGLSQVANRFREEAPAIEMPDGTPDGQGLITLASLKLPTACMPLTHRPISAEQSAEIAATIANGSLDSLICCTQCHREGVPQPKSERLVAVVQQSCQACHRG
jgi:hypothetical protein